VLGLVGGEKVTSKYKPSQAGPIYLSSGGPSATSRRTVRDIPADRPLCNFAAEINSAEPLVINPYELRTVRLLLADRPLCNFAAEINSTVPLVNNPHERRTVRLLPTDRPLYQISFYSEFCQLSQFQLQYGIIAHIKI
jgi:hypothetical protein